jgi:RNA polymerase sigma factor (sigma-70 family)
MAVSETHVVDDVAARQIVEDVNARSGQQLFGFARRLGLRDDEADDAVQEALLRLWRSVGDGTILDSPVAWTFRTTYRLAMDRHRLRRRAQALLDRFSSFAPHDTADNADELVAVWSEVDRLPARQRHVLYLHYRADLTFEVIARVLDIETSSARSAASRGMTTLRERLGGER